MSRDFSDAAASLPRFGSPAPASARKEAWPTIVDGRLERAMAGDRDAVAEIIGLHHAPVYRVCLRMMGGREDAEDAAQEVFVRMMRVLPKYDASRPFAPWLYAIALNVCRDHLRKRKYRTTQPLEAASDRYIAVPPRAREKLSAEDDLEILETGLQSLPEKERAAIVLRDIEGLTTREVAQAMGTKEETVRSQISRARVKLRAYRDRVRSDES